MFAAFIANNIYYLLLNATINSYIVARTVHISLSTQRCIFFSPAEELYGLRQLGT